jgi:uncharacterized membrane protein YfcA
LGLAAHAAVPINLAVSLATVLAALPVRLAASSTDQISAWWPVVAAMILGGIVAAYVGAGWLRRVSSDVLSRLIAILLVVLGVVMIVEAIVPLVPAGLLPDVASVRVSAGAAFGVVIGAISSLLGVAGGEVIIPTLVIGYGVPIALAGTLSLLISLPTMLVGLWRHLRAGAFEDRSTLWAIIVPMALGAIVGAPLGGWLAAYAPGALIKAALGLLLIWSAWKVFGKD